MPTSDNSPIEKSPKRVTVIGVGTCGCRAVEQMARKPSRAVDFVSIDTDPDALEHCKVSRPKQISISGLRAARPQHAKESAEQAAGHIRAALTGAELVVIAAGMTDATAVGAAPVVARIAQELDILVAAVVTLPGEWDGTPKRLARAQTGVADLRMEIPAVFVLPGNTLYAMLGNDDASLSEMDGYIDAMVVQMVSSIVDATEGRADVDVDFQDFRRVLNVPGATAVATANLQRREIPQAIDRLLACPLLAGNDLRAAQEVLVALRGASRRLSDAGSVVRAIAQATSDTASLLAATILDESLGEQLQLTLIATGVVGAPH